MEAMNLKLPEESRSQVLEISLSKNTVSDFYKSILEDLPANGIDGVLLYKSFDFDSRKQEIIHFIQRTDFKNITILNSNSGLKEISDFKNINIMETDKFKNYSFLILSSPQINYAIIATITEEDIRLLNPSTMTIITQSPKVIDFYWHKISEQAGIMNTDIVIHNPDDMVLASEKVVFDVICKLDSSRVVSDRRVFELSSLLRFLNSISGRFIEDEFLQEVGKKLIELTEAPVGLIQSQDIETDEMQTLLFWEGFKLFIGKELAEMDFPCKNYIETLQEEKSILFNLSDDESPFLEPENLTSLNVSTGILYPLHGPEKIRGSLILLFPETTTKAELNHQFFDEIAIAVSIGFKQLISHQRIHKEAITDSMTGLYNHRFFVDQLSKEMQRSRRYQNPLSLLMLDIDHFKNYNDTNGHPAGDELLKRIGDIFKGSVRRTDYVVRYGGEEFAIILPETPLENAQLVAEKIRKTIEKEVFHNQEAQPGSNLTISIGVAEHSKEFNLVDEFVNSADVALYDAKETGRNKVCSAGEDRSPVHI